MLSEVLADGLVDHDPAPEQSPGPKGIAEFWATFKTAFPDVAIEPVQVIATDDFVSAVLACGRSGTGLGMGPCRSVTRSGDESASRG